MKEIMFPYNKGSWLYLVSLLRSIKNEDTCMYKLSKKGKMLVHLKKRKEAQSAGGKLQVHKKLFREIETD